MATLGTSARGRHASAASQGTPSSKNSVLNIGEVLALLAEDFPQITASKIRFLEEKGLISPQRTAAGYRKYTKNDADRLRFILALQRDQYLPLRVIKDYLDAVDRGEEPEQLPGGMKLTPQTVTESFSEKATQRRRSLTRSELIGATGATGDLIDALLQYRLIQENPAGRFTEHSVKITRSCVQLAQHGIEPRHLGIFRQSADRQVALVKHAITPLAGRKDVASRARTAETAREISDSFLAIHTSLVDAALSELDH